MDENEQKTPEEQEQIIVLDEVESLLGVVESVLGDVESLPKKLFDMVKKNYTNKIDTK